MSPERCIQDRPQRPKSHPDEPLGAATGDLCSGKVDDMPTKAHERHTELSDPRRPPRIGSHPARASGRGSHAQEPGAEREARDERRGPGAERPAVMIPNRRKRLPLEAPLMRVVATAGIVGIAVVIAAIMGSQVRGALTGLARRSRRSCWPPCSGPRAAYNLARGTALTRRARGRRALAHGCGRERLPGSDPRPRVPREAWSCSSTVTLRPVGEFEVHPQGHAGTLPAIKNLHGI